MAYDMAAYHTLLDVAKIHNNKELLPPAEVLHKKNGLIQVASWMEANQLISNVGAKEVALPSGTWRSINEGIAPTKGQDEQFVEQLGRIESRAEYDEFILDDIEPDPARYRFIHDMKHVEGLGQAIASAFFYGDNVLDVNKPRGIQPRYNSTSLSNVHSVGCADAGAVTSLYCVQFGTGKVNLLYSRDASKKTVKIEDMGKQLVITNTTTGAGLYKYVTKFTSIMGINIEDDRAVQRVCNIGTDGADEVQYDLLIWALDNLPDPDDMAGTVIFCNRRSRFQLDKIFRDKPNMWYTDTNEYGQRVDYIRGARIVMAEAIVNTETVVS